MSTSVPVVDLQDYINKEKRSDFIQKLGDAFRFFGFVRVKGHNVTSSITDPAYESAKKYFSLSSRIKSKYIIKGGAGQRGYTPYGIESAKDSDIPDLKEFWHVGRELPEDDPLYDDYANNIWPVEVDDFQNNMLDLYDALEDCSDILLEALALYLGESKDTFTQIIDKGNTILRLLYYPALEGTSVQPGAVRAAEHEDILIEGKIGFPFQLEGNRELGDTFVDSYRMSTSVSLSSWLLAYENSIFPNSQEHILSIGNNFEF